MEQIKLNASNFDLTLKVNSNNYCSLILSKNGIKRELGNEDIKVLIQKFLLMLKENNISQNRNISDDCQYINFVNLSEIHTALYVKRVVEGIELLFQNGSNLTTIETVFLTTKECKLWIEKLEKIQEYNFI